MGKEPGGAGAVRPREDLDKFRLSISLNPRYSQDLTGTHIERDSINDKLLTIIQYFKLFNL